MPLANDMTLLLNKIERRLGLTPLLPHLPEYCNKESWSNIINEDSLVTFSRYFPNRLKIIINDDTCYKKKDEQGVVWYYIKDEILQGTKLLGVRDIDWTDNSTNNSAFGSFGTYYYPSSFPCPAATFESILGLQMAADFASLYNRGIVIEYRDYGRFCLKGIGNMNYDLNSFSVILLVEHRNISTISPTKMEIFESLAMADVAQYLYQTLKYFDGLDTAFVNIDLKLSELNDFANKRESIIEDLKNSSISAANEECPIVWCV